MGLAAGRSRRSRRENTGRSAALDKIRSGQKNKYEVTDDDKVYDMVDENEYSRRVQERLEDDWIVDDGEWVGLGVLGTGWSHGGLWGDVSSMLITGY